MRSSAPYAHLPKEKRPSAFCVAVGSGAPHKTGLEGAGEVLRRSEVRDTDERGPTTRPKHLRGVSAADAAKWAGGKEFERWAKAQPGGFRGVLSRGHPRMAERARAAEKGYFLPRSSGFKDQTHGTGFTGMMGHFHAEQNVWNAEAAEAIGL